MIREPDSGGQGLGERHFGAPSALGEPCCSDCQPAAAPNFGIGAIPGLGAFAHAPGPVGMPFWGPGGPEGPAAFFGPNSQGDYVYSGYRAIGPYVDIFLSAGPHEKKADGTTGASCEPQNGGNCGLYRVRWDLGAERAAEVEQLRLPVRWPGAPANIGTEEPAVGNGDRLAFLYRSYALEGGAEQGSFILTLPGAGGVGIIGDVGSHAKDRPQWPVFLDDDTLLYEKSEKDGSGVPWRTLWTAPTDGTTHTAVAGLKGTRNSLLPDGRDTKTVSYGNPQVDHSTGTPRVVSFGIDESSAITIPHVTSATGTDREDFDLTGVPHFFNAQHPTWSRDGSKIMATRQDDPQWLDGGPQKVRALFTFQRLGASGTDWTVEKRTFEPLGVGSMPSAFSGYACELVTFKYAHWCGDDDHVVATVYCSDLTTNVIETSRVLLINIADPAAPVYYDITRKVAEAFPEMAGTKKWRSVFSVCRDVV